MEIKGLKVFNNKNRDDKVRSFANKKYDLIIIGGGITGAGIALDASLRGMKVLLLEKKDFASGTSSKSTKLIHGGLRYLKQLEIGLVRESGTERAVAHNNACHLVHPEKMLLPIVRNGSFSKFTASIAISVYDRLAKVKSTQRRRVLTKSKVLEIEPLLNKDILKSGIMYSEYRTDDARLTIELIKAARRNDADAINYMEVVKFKYYNEKIVGVICYDHIQDTENEFSCNHVISSSGPWVDIVTKRDRPDATSNLHMSKGSHIVLDKKDLKIQQSTYFDAFDGRMIFAIPRDNVVYVGTTDTTYSGHPDDIHCTEEDAIYLLDALKGMFNLDHLTLDDIKSSWAGIRPLIKQKGRGPTEISRKDEIFISDSGLITIAGGKLTGFRKMAKKVVDLVSERSENNFGQCQTLNYTIHHDPFNSYENYLNFVKDLQREFLHKKEYDIQHLVSTYGKDALPIIKYAEANNISIEKSQLLYTLEYECVYHPLDHIDRRTGYLFFNIQRAEKLSLTASDSILEYLNLDKSWSEIVLKETQERIKINSLSNIKENHLSS